MRSIFSGEHSKKLWDAIGRIKKPKVHDAVYLMGCYNQDLEHSIESMNRRLTILEETHAGNHVPATAMLIREVIEDIRRDVVSKVKDNSERTKLHAELNSIKQRWLV